MSFTGPSAEGPHVHEGSPAREGTGDTVFAPVIRRRDAGSRALRQRHVHEFRGADHAADAGFEAIDRTAGWLRGQQAADGHWRAPLEGDTILESEYLLLLAWAGRLDHPHARGAGRRILKQQLPGGGWSIYPGGPIDVSASVKAYLALKLLGHDPDEPALVRGRQAIEDRGGPWAVNSFTKFYLALLGQMPYSACPAVPPEAVLLPEWFPVNLHRVSAWSRTMIVPLSLMWAFKPLRRVSQGRGIAELFTDRDRRGPPPPADTSFWAGFFRGIDRLMKACEAMGLTPLRARGVQACRRWMLARFDGSDGLGAIFPPIVWSIIALESMGCDKDSPEVREAWSQLDQLIEIEGDGTIRLEPCRSPVWDTAITVIALVESRGGVVRGRQDVGHQPPFQAPLQASLEQAIDWLLDREIRTAGDWAERTQSEPSGWCFEYANRFYPDVDDTAMVVIALATWRSAVQASRGGEGPRLAAVNAAIRRGSRWLEAMQNDDGGWGAFDRDNNCEFLCKVPFADHNAMIDPSSPDLAGRVLEAYGKIGLRAGHPSVDRAVAYVRRSQDSDGAWYGRWGVNYIYGTWQVLEGLKAVGISQSDDAVVRGAEWLEAHQQSDGGWGETPESYADRTLAGTGVPTASQTAWAVAGLVAAGRGDSAAVRGGVNWLELRQEADGTWEQREFTGTGFPQVFYLRYHYYPIYFPLMALARARRAAAAGHRERVA
jgi:squalene-hopene/tetraprenyl-beta-curcumene cyclase